MLIIKYKRLIYFTELSFLVDEMHRKVLSFAQFSFCCACIIIVFMTCKVVLNVFANYITQYCNYFNKCVFFMDVCIKVKRCKDYVVFASFVCLELEVYERLYFT